MKKSIITTLITCLILLRVDAQKDELLKGKWKYSDIENKEKLDSTLLWQAKMMFGKTEIDFAPDGKLQYQPLAGNPYGLYTGTWSLAPEGNKINITLVEPSKGSQKASVWDVKTLTDNELRLNMGPAVIIFGKVKTEPISTKANVTTAVSEEQFMILAGGKSRQVYAEKGAEITDVTNLDNSVHLIYRLNGKYGFLSQDNSGYTLKKLPAVFSSISVISTYKNNPRLQLVYNGETVNAYHDDIKMAFGGMHVAIKADMYGAVCGNPKCKNGVIGTTTQVEKGETVTRRINNTTYWYKGHLVPADITIVETNPDKIITEKQYCKDPIHSVKTVMLFWENATGTYKVEKH